MVRLAFATPGSREKRFSNASVSWSATISCFSPATANATATCPVQEAALPCPGSALFEQSSRQRKSETVALINRTMSALDAWISTEGSRLKLGSTEVAEIFKGNQTRAFCYTTLVSRRKG